MEREIQKIEAIERMRMLDLYPAVIDEFKNEDKINYSERAILYWLNDEMKEKIREWEEETGNIVYHAVYNIFEFGRCLSLLYVSKYADEWSMDVEDLREGYPLAYVLNLDCPDFSEYGTIGIKKAVGGILRTC